MQTGARADDLCESTTLFEGDVKFEEETLKDAMHLFFVWVLEKNSILVKY